LASPPVLAQGSGTTGAANDASPWAALDAARKSLAAAGPERAEFVQTYVPAGFSSGEKETGVLALRLPDCLRWDYAEPYPKSFLLCGDRVYAWNPEDRRGQASTVKREEQPGLDLLLLPVEELADRYRASAQEQEEEEGDRVAVRLEPKPEMAGHTELTEATLVVDTRSERLVEVSYKDGEGNLTRFAISGYEPLPDEALFEPPNGISWEDGSDG
jgi:outer membrane lipoprotein carrier protein